MKWIRIILKVLLWSLLGGIVCIVLPVIISMIKKPPSPYELQIPVIIELYLVTILIIGLVNVLFIFLLYLTAYIVRKNISRKIFSLKYLLPEIILMDIIYILPIDRIRGTWWQAFIPFVILYILWWVFIIISIIQNKSKNDM